MSTEMVSRCCGDTFDEVDIIEDWSETHICSECGKYCEITEDYDYRQQMLDERAEAMEDEKRDLR